MAEEEFEDVASAVEGEESGSGTEDASSAAGTADDEDEEDHDFDMTSRIGHFSRAEIAELPIEQQLQKWQETLLPIEVDLVIELDASNLFLVHVESIIYDMITSKEINFVEDMQFLRFTHAIEQLLARIRTAGGVFRLVFFEASKEMFSIAFPDTDVVWAFRQAFLVHCRGTGIDHAVFPHWYSDEWKQHCKEWRPTFFLLSGEAVEQEDQEEDEDEEEEDKAKRLKLKGFFHALMLKCLSYKTHVAFLRGLQFRGNRIMAFSLEPDCYEAYIDSNVQAALVALFSEEEEEIEEGDGDALVKELKAFKKQAGEMIEEEALLRSFLTVRFVKSTMEAMKGQNKTTIALMKVVVKALLLEEMMLRHIPMQNRAMSTCDTDDWEMYSEKICAAMERYFGSVAEDLACLARASVAPPLTVPDLFDGRLYRHVFHSVISTCLESDKTKVEAKDIAFEEWAEKELLFLWSQAVPDKKDPFFPIEAAAIKELDGIDPPELPAKAVPRSKPLLKNIKEGVNELVDALEAEVETKNVELDDEELVLQDEAIWSKYHWKPTAQLDAVKEAETMEKNEGEKKFEEKMKAKGKITARDLEFQRKYQEKKRQMALKALAAYANSLTGSNKMHHPIIMKEETSKDKKAAEKGKEEKKDEPAKLGKKHQEMLEKRYLEEEEKKKENDKTQLKAWDKDLEAIPEILNLQKLETKVLDLLLGFDRITDSFVGFPAVSDKFKTSEARCKVVTKAIKGTRTALQKMQVDRETDEEKKTAARRVVRYLMSMVQECFNSYKKDLDAKGIKLLQETLLSIRFPKAASTIFKSWYDAQMEKAEAELAKSAGDGKADGKDKKDKKEKKDDKKDKKDDKKDKKDKKGDKEEGGDSLTDLAAELGKSQVKKETELIWSGVGDDEFAYQLKEMGQFMTRTVGNAKDEKQRVNFKPDRWQRDLLDIVDDQESALIVAPTASGKTFIGYYVMDKVLRADNEGVAVYVAPSKALVNQVSAEIYARFSSKTYPAHSKNELLGTFLKEYNSAGGVMEPGKWKNCQVLVTIPHILELLLLSPSNQDWVKKLKYVVFDEVHCIGGEDGLQWEHCMQLIPCPFLALSATVAEPQHFHGWLNRVNAKKEQSKVKMVVHTERFNDLYKYIYRNGQLQPLHPFCCLKEQAVKQSGLSTDLTLTPQEMGRLFFDMQQVLGANEKLDRLSPAKYFADHVGFLTKNDARRYEKELKQTFVEMVKDGTLDGQKFADLQLRLQQMDDKPAFAPPTRAAIEAAGDDEAALQDFARMGKETNYMKPALLYKLCKDLDKMDALPAIVFNFSRKEIDRMLNKLIQELKDQQYNKYYGTEEASFKSKRIMERRQAQYENQVKEYEQVVKMKANKNQEGKASRKNAEEGERGAVKDEAADVNEDVGEEPEPPEDLLDQIDNEFSFHSVKALGQWHSEIHQMLKELKVKKVPQYLLDGLRRGIGMHHEGCRTNYRQAVEILFRRGYLKVVFATGTLALGINMPCRSTIFCGDALDLNGLMFRQMSGRAGRRGFDLLGQVVFLDMSFNKISSLVSSDLPVLAGEFNMSPTTLLRALHQWELLCMQEEVVDDKGVAKVLPRSREDMLRTLAPSFSLPFFRSELADLDTQVAYQTRFSVDFLYREGLVSGNGNTRGLANLATQLFEIEPANILMARLLGKGLLHEYLQKEKSKEKKADRRTHLTVKLVTILSWLLYRKRLPDHLPKNAVHRKKYLPSKECPKLPLLPDNILTEVIGYNQSAFEHVQQLAWSVGTTKKINESDLVLPFSDKAFRLGWDPRGMPFDTDNSSLAQSIVQQMVRYRARSPFSAISGTGDYFTSPNDLVVSTRNVLHLDLNSFPALAMPMLGDPGLEGSNSWMLDFMIHGKIKYLWEDNGIGPTKAWKLISDFGEAVKKATVAIKAFSPKDDIVLTTFEALRDEISKYLKGEGGK